MTPFLIAADSRPDDSASSGGIVVVRPATVFWSGFGAGVVMSVMTSPFWCVSVSEGDIDVADGDGRTDLHVFLLGARHRLSDEVFHRAARLAAGAAVADAHPASAFG